MMADHKKAYERLKGVNMYNYLEALKDDIKDYLESEFEYKYSHITDIEDLERELNDDLFCHDSITGNASGSYTFDSYVAREYVLDNTDELKDALDTFCVDAETVADKFLSENWEYFDVTIRCYLLGQAINEFLEEYEEEFEEYFENKEDEE